MSACTLAAISAFPVASANLPRRDPITVNRQDSFPGASPPILTAKAVVLFDAHTGVILFRQNETQPRQVASTQKLLTALIVAENGDLDKPIVIKRSDAMEPPLKLGLRSGETYTRRALLTAMLMKSANDAAAALARDNARSTAAFAEKMNRRMVELHGNTSHFVNPNGLPLNGQYSTARDMASVARAVYAHPLLRGIVNCRTYHFRLNNGKIKILCNTNCLLKYSFCNGMKTGYTRGAGHCLIASGKWKEREVIAVILGVSVRSRIWKEAQSLLIYGLGMRPEEIAAARLVSSSRARAHAAAFKPKRLFWRW
ncbi:D-alanyl-D-alanine carboxypeptidase DacF precursor [Candidatus Xiphinematobacter sp. Idaho Grape]|uniref:D-alanyl-D-alanine carboxypeptidase family protein n=1 Tax=Candidatus Xiphinematobacter sp. Idaho Grape TaxID=1704307 RepID=UPI0007057FA0|nr:serine hydrolase [Candidatus Xiphinematobacter sp. Idaho Grape]ALJ56919.1 D-alanyl-D-alanine carboxypeptidase DacF precursor [Candidatus Xiphinematobacter sp. Idaho Grape]